ncbi:MAG TPA: UDP-N-acetylglucosamine 2-epimerase (non-hydrolyzing) [Acidobacteriaceae bacterium]
MKVASIVGARPQFIKAVVVSKALASVGVSDVLVHTGQHYDFEMSALFFEELDLSSPKYHLRIGSGSHGAQTGRMLEAIESVLLRDRPDMVVAYGDTNSTLAGALAAAKLEIPICHVEAGMRSFNRQPEEINRVLTDHIADLLFAPTATAVRNLNSEGIPAERIIRTGDVMYDAALQFAARADAVSQVLRRLELQPRMYLLATLHRSENTDDPGRLRAIFEGIADVARQLPVVLPLHPRTRREIERTQISETVLQRIRLVEPLGYLDMTMLEKHALLIATDSGGVQKEAYFHGVPCVTLRGETEWTETLVGGCNQLVFPANADVVATRIREALGSEPSFRSDLYGDGHSAMHIANVISCWGLEFRCSLNDRVNTPSPAQTL